MKKILGPILLVNKNYKAISKIFFISPSKSVSNRAAPCISYLLRLGNRSTDRIRNERRLNPNLREHIPGAVVPGDRRPQGARLPGALLAEIVAGESPGEDRVGVLDAADAGDGARSGVRGTVAGVEPVPARSGTDVVGRLHGEVGPGTPASVASCGGDHVAPHRWAWHVPAALKSNKLRSQTGTITRGL